MSRAWDAQVRAQTSQGHCVFPGCTALPLEVDVMSEQGHGLCYSHRAAAEAGELDLGGGFAVVVTPEKPHCDHEWSRAKKFTTSTGGQSRFRACLLCDEIKILTEDRKEPNHALELE